MSSTLQISFPGRVGEGVHAHYVYTITSKIYYENTNVVDRRYSDFLWISEQLFKHYPGYVIPPLPEKVVGILQGQNFLEKRRNGLHTFLSRTLNHPILSHSPCLKQFLTSTAVEFTAIKTASQTTVTEKKEALSSWWGKTYQRLSENEKVKQLAHKAGKEIPSVKTQQDLLFDDLNQHMLKTYEILKQLQTRIESAYKQGKAFANSLSHAQESIELLLESENQLSEYKPMPWKDIQPLMELRRHQVDIEMEDFYEQVMDTTRYVASALRAMELREDRRFAYQAQVSMATKGMSQNSTSSQQRDSNALSIHQRVMNAKEEFDLIHERVMEEVSKFSFQKRSQIQQFLIDYTRLHMLFNEEINKTLQTTMPALEQWQMMVTNPAEIHAMNLTPSTPSHTYSSLSKISAVENSMNAVKLYPGEDSNDSTIPTAVPVDTTKSFTDVAL